MVRILITGSRNWRDSRAVDMAIMKEVAAYAAKGDRSYVTIVHGGASGADTMAATFGKSLGYFVERHPARWMAGGVYNPQAGLQRNLNMVRMGADVCLAFVARCDARKCTRKEPHGSHGASHTASYAERAGIRTVRITDGWDEGYSERDSAFQRLVNGTAAIAAEVATMAAMLWIAALIGMRTSWESREQWLHAQIVRGDRLALWLFETAGLNRQGTTARHRAPVVASKEPALEQHRTLHQEAPMTQALVHA